MPLRKSLGISDFRLHTVDCRSNIWGDKGDGKCDKGDEIWCGLQCYNEALTIYVTKMAKLLQSHSTCNLPYFDKWNDLKLIVESRLPYAILLYD